MDKNFNEIDSSSLQNARQNHSLSELSHSNIAKFDLGEDVDSVGSRKLKKPESNDFKSSNDDAQRKLDLAKKSSLASASVLPVSGGANLVDVTELWKVEPRPAYTEDVIH